MTTPAGIPDGFTRKYFMPSRNRIVLSCAAALGLINGLLNPYLLPLVPAWLVIVVVMWCVPIATVTDEAIRPSLFRSRVAWRDVAHLTTRPRRTSSLVQLTLTDGRTVPTVVPGTDAELLQHLVYSAHTSQAAAAG